MMNAEGIWTIVQMKTGKNTVKVPENVENSK